MAEESTTITHPGAAMTCAEVDEYIAVGFPSNRASCIDIGPRHAVARLATDPALLRPGGIISGPTVFGACDVSMYFACFGAVGLEPMTLTSELSIRFMRPARGAALLARTDLHHVGRRSIIGSIVAWIDGSPDAPVAVAQGTYVRPTAG